MMIIMITIYDNDNHDTLNLRMYDIGTRHDRTSTGNGDHGVTSPFSLSISTAHVGRAWTSAKYI